MKTVPSRPCCFKMAGRVDQHAMAFPARDSRGQEHHTLVGFDAPFGPERLDPRRGDRLRRKLPEIRAAVDHLDLRCGPWIMRRDEAAGVFGVGDHDIAPRHDRVIS